MATTFVPKCTTCSTGAKLMRCPCALVWYCSKQHQREDWKQHKRHHEAAMAGVFFGPTTDPVVAGAIEAHNRRLDARDARKAKASP